MRLRTASLLFVVATGLLFGCSKSDTTVVADSCQLAGTKSQAYSDAIKAWATAQTPANCTALKTAANAYIDAAANCSTVTKAQLDAARSSINSGC